MVASCGVSVPGNVTYPDPYTKQIPQYTDGPTSYSYSSSTPYNSFAFIGDTLYGQTNFYILSRQSNLQLTAETQPNYIIYVTIGAAAAGGIDATVIGGDY
jgi:hypothetical protein